MTAARQAMPCARDALSSPTGRDATPRSAPLRLNIGASMKNPGGAAREIGYAPPASASTCRAPIRLVETPTARRELPRTARDDERVGAPIRVVLVRVAPVHAAPGRAAPVRVVGRPLDPASRAAHAGDPRAVTDFLRERTCRLAPAPHDDLGYGVAFENGR